MEEIKVGEYVRTIDGKIDKVIEILGKYILLKNNFKITEFIENRIYSKIKDVVKHSPNIIDLIEEGDYVNGHKILEIKQNTESGLRYLMYDYVPIKYYVERTDKIKSIVTKEQFNQVKYEV